MRGMRARGEGRGAWRIRFGVGAAFFLRPDEATSTPSSRRTRTGRERLSTNRSTSEQCGRDSRAGGGLNR